MEKTSKWHWGVNRWWVFGFIVITIICVQFIAVPVQPHIQVAPERIFTEPIFSLPIIGDFYLVNTLTSMILVDVIIILLALLVRNGVKSGSLVPKGIAGAFEMIVEMLYNLTETSAGKYTKQIFPWFATIIILVFVANLTKLLPGMETIGLMHHAEHGYVTQDIGGNWAILTGVAAHEGDGSMVTPFFRGLSTDLNFTVALALISVIMTQIIGVRAQGIRYFTKFINFTTLFSKPLFGFMDFVVGVLELISELAKILSFAFRLFGVMFAGTVLVALGGVMVPVFAPSLIFAFEVFMGVIQAFVFGMLTMVFMSQATQGHGEHAED